jgi:hypothetical protein
VEPSSNVYQPVRHWPSPQWLANMMYVAAPLRPVTPKPVLQELTKSSGSAFGLV